MGGQGGQGGRGRQGWPGRSFPALLFLLAAACTSHPPDNPKNYAAKIQAGRSSKDSILGSTDDPIPKPGHAKFLPLAYFPIDSEYNVPAGLKPSTDRTVIEIPLSVGGADPFRRAGTLEFVVKGQSLKLTAFVPAAAKSDDRLFVPFGDLTNGAETYAAGRFLDLDRTGNNVYELDFNKAYFPYCYYNPSYACPIPPAENKLKIPIRAGEKMK
jgi:uncharacterized protein (DUF1684 family)